VNKAHILRIEASAGAGKTYRLTSRFLELLATLPPGPQALRSIVAITFTNKAAAEMKERLIRSLKEIALGEGAGSELSRQTGLGPNKARKWLEVIFEHYHDLQVRTIDSLVFTILKGIALEVGLRPDLEAELKEDILLNRAYDRLLLALREDEDSLIGLFREVLIAFLEVEARGGFNPERSIRKTLLDLFRYELRGQSLEVPDVKNTLSRLAEEVRRAAQEFLEAADARGLIFCYSWREKFEDPLEDLSARPFQKNSARELFKNPSQAEELEGLFRNFRAKLEEYLFVRAVERLIPYARLYTRLKEELEKLRRQEGLIHGGGWVEIVEKILREDGVPLVYCKLGARFHHFLIDEFQDTSRKQWEALKPLVVEALASGGTLTYVGDVKQAIYVWRGGDPALFREVPEELPAELRHEPLPYNWRACEDLVNFNNRFFSLLTDEKTASWLAGNFLYGEKAREHQDCPFVKKLTKDFREIFSRVQQEIPAPRSGGEVSIYPVAGQTKAEIRENTLSLLKELIPQTFEAYRGRGVVAVLVRTNEQAEEVAKLLFELGLPAVTENALRLSNSPLVRSLVSLLTFLDYPYDEIALAGFLRSPLVSGYLDLPASFWKEMRSGPSLLETLRDKYPSFFRDHLQPLLEKSGFLSPYDLVREICLTFDVFRRFPEEEAFLKRFLSLVLTFEQEGVGLSSFLECWQERGFEERLGLPEDLEAVRVLTIHAAKGLEFDAVFLPFLQWEVKTPRLVTLDDGTLGYAQQPYPAPIREKVLKQLAEQALENLNLLYVAFTRARERLYLFVPEKRPLRARFGTADVINKFLKKLGYY